jgi:hypothetical protein
MVPQNGGAGSLSTVAASIAARMRFGRASRYSCGHRPEPGLIPSTANSTKCASDNLMIIGSAPMLAGSWPVAAVTFDRVRAELSPGSRAAPLTGLILAPRRRRRASREETASANRRALAWSATGGLSGLGRPERCCPASVGLPHEAILLC